MTLKMRYSATASFTLFVFISSTTISHAKIEQISASETGNHLATQQNAAISDESVATVKLSADNVAEPDEHHRIVILVPQLVSPHGASAAYSQRAKKPKKKPVAPRPPKKKPKTHHHHPHVVPVVHSGKVIHAHHHHGHVDHGHAHVGKAKHNHKHYGNAHHKHGHFGVGKVTHKHIGPIKPPPPPPPPPPPHKPKHPHHLSGVDVFNQNSYNQILHQNRLRQNAYQNPYFNQQPQQQLPPAHLQHQQQILHHRGFASQTANFGNPAVASDPYAAFYNGADIGGVQAQQAAFGNGRRTANDRRDLFPPSSNVAQLIQIRKLPSEDGGSVFNSFIDKNTRSSLAAAALAFGNENDNENQVDVDGGEADAENENENENENEAENDAENENENENENEVEGGYVAGGGALERAIEEAAFAQKAHNFGRLRRPDATNTAEIAVPAASDSEETFAALQFNGVHQDEASLNYPTFVNPPPRNKVIAFSDAYHYQY